MSLGDYVLQDFSQAFARPDEWGTPCDFVCSGVVRHVTALFHGRGRQDGEDDRFSQTEALVDVLASEITPIEAPSPGDEFVVNPGTASQKTWRVLELVPIATPGMFRCRVATHFAHNGGFRL